MKKSDDRGITLVVLVITIIILLILVGITISALNGKNQIFNKVNQAKKNYSMSQAKENLELAIAALQIEEESKGEELTKEKLPKLNSDEIDVGSVDSFPVEISYNKYKFKVDENFVVAYYQEVDGTIVTYTTDPEGYTNKDKVNILIKAKNKIGIKEIEYPDGQKLMVDDNKTEVATDFEVTKNGVYKFKVIDNNNKEISKDVVIDKIDKLPPKDFIPESKNINIDSFTVVSNAEDEDETVDNTKSGIKNYEYYIKDEKATDYTKYETENGEYEFSGLNSNTKYSIYVIAYDRASNSKKSKTIEVSTKAEPVPPLTKITFNETNATKKVLEYPILTLDGMMNCTLEPNIGENVTLEITSKETENSIYYYSLDGGKTWIKYNGIVNTTYQADNLIQVKTIYKNTTESKIKNVKKYLYDSTVSCTSADALDLNAYDRDFNSYTKHNIATKDYVYFNIYPDCWGKYMSVYYYSSNGGGAYGFGNSSSKFEYGEWFTDSNSLNTKSIFIPNCTWVDITIGRSGLDMNLYEIWCSENNLTGNTYSNDNLPE